MNKAIVYTFLIFLGITLLTGIFLDHKSRLEEMPWGKMESFQPAKDAQPPINK
jgi:hypothetical protein